MNIEDDRESFQPTPLPITSDFGIFKLLIKPGDCSKLLPSYKKGTKVYLHYRAYNIPFSTKIKDQADIFKYGTGLVELSQAPSSISSSEIDVNRQCVIGNTRFDKSPIEIRTGWGLSFEGLELAIKTMKQGEISRFIMQPKYAEPFIQLESSLRKQRHDLKHPHSIGRGNCCAYLTEEDQELFKLYGCAIDIEIEIVKVDESSTLEYFEMTLSQKAEEISKLKQKGDDLVHLKKYNEASKLYYECTSLCSKLRTESLIKEDESVDLSQLESIESAALSNNALCLFKLNHFNDVIKACDAILKKSDNIKARFRRAQSYARLDKIEVAMKEFNILRGKIDNNVLYAELDFIEKQKKEHAAVERSIFGNLFNK